MEGHYHVEFEPEDDEDESNYVNGTLEEVKAAIDASTRRVIDCHFVCAFGCGLPHKLTEQDEEKLGLLFHKTIERVDVRAHCAYCGQHAMVKRGESVECSVPDCGREIAVCKCGGVYGQTSRGCGVRICDECGDHKGLARCFCGWSASGGDGRRELEDMGETIDE